MHIKETENWFNGVWVFTINYMFNIYKLYLVNIYRNSIFSSTKQPRSLYTSISQNKAKQPKQNVGD
jgi:hypothetical protein